MAESYIPATRRGHVAAAVEGKLYVWGGMRSDLPAVHDHPVKTAFTSVVDVLDLQVKRVLLLIVLTYKKISTPLLYSHRSTSLMRKGDLNHPW